MTSIKQDEKKVIFQKTVPGLLIPLLFVPTENKVICQSGKEISYQYLVVAPGIN
jgi:sulfide:quinone oxidoreductase